MNKKHGITPATGSDKKIISQIFQSNILFKFILFLAYTLMIYSFMHTTQSSQNHINVSRFKMILFDIQPDHLKD